MSELTEGVGEPFTDAEIANLRSGHVIEINRRVFIHEAETAPCEHDANGACCLRARLTPTTPTTAPEMETNDA